MQQQAAGAAGLGMVGSGMVGSIDLNAISPCLPGEDVKDPSSGGIKEI